jgi:hypothetical protein
MNVIQPPLQQILSTNGLNALALNWEEIKATVQVDFLNYDGHTLLSRRNLLEHSPNKKR